DRGTDGAGDRRGARDRAGRGRPPRRRRRPRPDRRHRRARRRGRRRRGEPGRDRLPPRRHLGHVLAGRDRPRHRRLGQARHPGQQRRDRRPLRAALGIHPGRVGPAAGDRPHGGLPRLPSRRARDARGRLGSDREHRLHRRQRGQPQRGALLGRQGGRDRPDEGPGQGGRHRRCPRQLRHPGGDRDRHPRSGLRRAHRLHDLADPDGPGRPARGGRRARRVPVLRPPQLLDRRRLRPLRRPRDLL
ncbi:MAG: 3-oxoacyl-[acyl-carrier protein] reductase, partial [uncultured Thermomicrobiales bacterium]